MIRFSPSFSYWLNVILLLVSGLTIFIAGLGANSEFYLKRIIALSALRQLGLMILTISNGLTGLVFLSSKACICLRPCCLYVLEVLFIL